MLRILIISHLQRDAATAPNVGDRVPYVIIKAARGAKVNVSGIDIYG